MKDPIVRIFHASLAITEVNITRGSYLQFTNYNKIKVGENKIEEKEASIFIVCKSNDHILKYKIENII